MKKIIYSVLFAATLLIAPITYGQDPPNPGSTPPQGEGNYVGGPPGGGAPIGSGLLILMALGAAYGGKKVYDFNKKKLAE